MRHVLHRPDVVTFWAHLAAPKPSKGVNCLPNRSDRVAWSCQATWHFNCHNSTLHRKHGCCGDYKYPVNMARWWLLWCWKCNVTILYGFIKNPSQTQFPVWANMSPKQACKFKFILTRLTLSRQSEQCTSFNYNETDGCKVVGSSSECLLKHKQMRSDVITRSILLW